MKNLDNKSDIKKARWPRLTCQTAVVAGRRHLAFFLIVAVILGLVIVVIIYWSKPVYQLVYADNYQLVKVEKVWNQSSSKQDYCQSWVQGLNLQLVDNQLKILRDTQEPVWTSPKEYKVTDYFCADVDGDQIKDLGLILWKQGYYGEDLPFFVNENPQDYGQHLFLYNWQDNQLKPKWHSSTLSKPILNFVVYDLNDDGLEELIMIEKSGRKKQLAIWQWQEWGFTKLFEFANNRLKQVTLIDNKIFIR